MSTQQSTHVDFTSTPDSNIVPAGEYYVEVAKAELGTSNAGKPMMTVTFNVIDGEHAGAKIPAWLSLQPQALFALKGFLKALGYDTSGGLDITPDEYIGKTLKVKVTVNKDGDGEDRNNVRKFSPISDEDDEDED